MTQITPRRLRDRYGSRTVRDQVHPGEVAILVEEILDLYELAYGAGLSPSRTGDGARYQRGSVANPTMDVATSDRHRRLRDSTKRTTLDLAKVVRILESNHAALRSALDALDPRATPDLKLEHQYRISRAELEESRQAARRRQGRGEVAV